MLSVLSVLVPKPEFVVWSDVFVGSSVGVVFTSPFVLPSPPVLVSPVVFDPPVETVVCCLCAFSIKLRMSSSFRQVVSSTQISLVVKRFVNIFWIEFRLSAKKLFINEPSVFGVFMSNELSGCIFKSSSCIAPAKIGANCA